MEKSKLELIQDDEHLRLIENVYKINCGCFESSSVIVDNENDLSNVREKIKMKVGKINSYKTIIFDCYGVILNSNIIQEF